MNLDSTALANIGVQVRDLDITGLEAFTIAKDLALKDSIEYLRIIENTMIQEGYGDFWNAVKTEGSSQEKRELQYEKFNHFPFQFISTGPLPEQDEAEYDTGFYLRVIIKTSADVDSGTNAGIFLTSGDETFPLDYFPIETFNIVNQVIGHNDFEMGKEAVYTVGPFAEFPTSIRLINDAPTFVDIVDAVITSFVKAFYALLVSVYDILVNQQDYVGTVTEVMDPKELRSIRIGEKISNAVSINGGIQGSWKITYSVSRTESTTFKVSLVGLKNVETSTGEPNGDEPFVLSRLNSFPGGSQFHYAPDGFGAFGQFCDGEEKAMIHDFDKITFEPGLGGLVLSFAIFESDLEAEDERKKEFEKFKKGGADDDKKIDDVLFKIGAAIGADWKMDTIKVYAFNRGDTLQSGEVLNYKTGPDEWITGGSESLPLSLNKSLLTTRQGIIVNTCEPSSMPSDTPSVSKAPSLPPSVSKAPSLTPSAFPTLSPSESTMPSLTPSVSAIPSVSAMPSQSPSESVMPSVSLMPTGKSGKSSTKSGKSSTKSGETSLPTGKSGKSLTKVNSKCKKRMSKSSSSTKIGQGLRRN